MWCLTHVLQLFTGDIRRTKRVEVLLPMPRCCLSLALSLDCILLKSTVCCCCLPCLYLARVCFVIYNAWNISTGVWRDGVLLCIRVLGHLPSALVARPGEAAHQAPITRAPYRRNWPWFASVPAFVFAPKVPLVAFRDFLVSAASACASSFSPNR